MTEKALGPGETPAATATVEGAHEDLEQTMTMEAVQYTARRASETATDEPTIETMKTARGNEGLPPGPTHNTMMLGIATDLLTVLLGAMIAGNDAATGTVTATATAIIDEGTVTTETDAPTAVTIVIAEIHEETKGTETLEEMIALGPAEGMLCLQELELFP